VDSATAPPAGEKVWDSVPDEEVVRRVRAGETELYEVIMRRYNQRLYRVARVILQNDSEAEDVMQDAYVRAYLHLDQFAGEARFSTWLTKIAVYEALQRRRRRSRMVTYGSLIDMATRFMKAMNRRDPEQQASAAELRRSLESAVDSLPGIYRTVFMLRAIEGLTVAETAACLDISEQAVKTRLHRARAFIRHKLATDATAAAAGAFAFQDTRCDRVVSAVLRRLAAFEPGF
jgi:RNA polymerase sigma-70 factor (ECF subfamily)